MEDREQFRPATDAPAPDVAGHSHTPVAPAGAYPDVDQHGDAGTREKVADQAREKADQAREMADDQRERAAHGMERAADTLRERSEQIPGGERTTEMANRAADRVEGVAHYLQDTDMSAMMSDVERVVRDHPREALIAAAAVGFFVGRAIRS